MSLRGTGGNTERTGGGKNPEVGMRLPPDWTSPGGLLGMPERARWGQTSGWDQEQVAWLMQLTPTQRASVCATPRPHPHTPSEGEWDKELP